MENFYESMFIVDVTNGEDAVKASVEKFTTLIANNGTTIDVAEWGKRRLAYPINDKPEGYYVVVAFKAEGNFPSELERLYNIDESIMRSLTIKLDHEPTVRPSAKVPEAEEAEEAAEEEAPAVVEEAVEAPAAEAEAEAETTDAE